MVFGKGRMKEGWDCDNLNEDGSRTCRRVIIKDDGTKMATGTEITLGVDPTTCKPVLSGDTQTILDDDDDNISSIANRMTSQCKKEKGL